MGKKRKGKLTDAAIVFIIKKRSDPVTNYTFEEITELLKTEFKINISLQAVAKSYRKYKDDKAFNHVVTVVENQSDNVFNEAGINNDDRKIDNQTQAVNIEKSSREKPTFEPIDVKVKSNKDFDEDAHKKYNFEDFLIPKET